MMESSESEVEDYMSMKFSNTPSTLTTAEEKRKNESIERGKITAREEMFFENLKQGLATSVEEKTSGTKKALQIMKSMGYK